MKEVTLTRAKSANCSQWSPAAGLGWDARQWSQQDYRKTMWPCA